MNNCYLCGQNKRHMKQGYVFITCINHAKVSQIIICYIYGGLYTNDYEKDKKIVKYIAQQ